MLNRDYAAKAKLSMAMVSPQRCRLVADLIRGQSLEEAHRRLLLSKVKSARIILKLLRSAMANAEQGGVASLDRLFISEITVNDGPRITRYMPRAQGRADARTKRTSHIQLKLSEKKVAKVAKKKKESSESAEKPKKTMKKSTKKAGAK